MLSEKATEVEHNDRDRDKSEGRYSESWDEDLDNLIRTPYIIGTRRELALTRFLSLGWEQ